MRLLASLALLLVSCAFCLPVVAEDNKQKLQQLNSQIDRLKKALDQEHSKQEASQLSLKQAEIAIGKLALELTNTNGQLQKQQAILNTLDVKQATYQAQLLSQQAALAGQLRAAYLLGNEGYIKMLLNLEDPSAADRLMTYYHYVAQYRLQLIRAFANTLLQVHTTKQQIDQHAAKLKALQTKQQQARVSLERSYSQRSLSLANIKAEIKNKNLKLTTLVADKNALEQLILRLEKAQTLGTFVNGTFNKLQGRLPWPVLGSISNHFGSIIGDSELKWNGILIKAALDQELRAVASGKVVFANWMPGYGLLLIIDHGNGFMTIYGRNHSLYKKVGSIVNAGDIIATVGSSGGYDEPGVYFAIRYKGKALDPEQWLTKKA